MLFRLLQPCSTGFLLVALPQLQAFHFFPFRLCLKHCQPCASGFHRISDFTSLSLTLSLGFHFCLDNPKPLGFHFVFGLKTLAPGWVERRTPVLLLLAHSGHFHHSPLHLQYRIDSDAHRARSSCDFATWELKPVRNHRLAGADCHMFFCFFSGLRENQIEISRMCKQKNQLNHV